MISEADDHRLRIIATEIDPTKLKNWMDNARRNNADHIYQAAFRRFCQLRGRDFNDRLDREFHEVITALETALSEVKGGHRRLNRTRQKLDRVGVRQLLSDLAMKPSPSEGFKYLLEFGMGDMTAESIIMRNKSLFDGIVVEKARNRLEKYGIAVPGETPE